MTNHPPQSQSETHPLQEIVMLFDTESRSPNRAEMSALSLAASLLGLAAPLRGGDVTSERPSYPATRLDAQTRRLTGSKGSVRLTSREWDSLSFFFQRRGEAISFGELAEQIWNSPAEYLGRAVIYDVMARLRKQLSSVGSEYVLVSVQGFGYMLQSQDPAELQQ